MSDRLLSAKSGRSGDSGIISKSILNMGLVNSIFRLVQDIDRLTG